MTLQHFNLGPNGTYIQELQKTIHLLSLIQRYCSCYAPSMKKSAALSQKQLVNSAFKLVTVNLLIAL